MKHHLLLAVFLFAAAALGEERPSALPPPVTRGLYRANWFVFLNAYVEDDARGAAAALEQMKKAAQGVGVRRLSDFSRTSLYEARKADASGLSDRADRGYRAALALDDSNLDAVLARMAFLWREGSYFGSAALAPAAAGALFATCERRLAIVSAAALWLAAAAAAAAIAVILVLFARHLPRLRHDIRERADRYFGRRAAVPLALVVFLLPVAFGLGPYWVLLFAAALLFAYLNRREQAVLAAGLLGLGLLPFAAAILARENILARSPLYVAAIDLEERREDASAEDGLRQASAVFAEEPDVWFLLGIYAERAGDSRRAMAAYDQAVIAGPSDYRPFLNRGNLHFQEGEFALAIRDYEEAAQRNARAVEVYYNLALARAETYDFDGQAAVLKKARDISTASVTWWSEHPTLSRVVSAPYPASRARRKVEQWNSQPRGRRLPGHAPPIELSSVASSPWVFGPWAALLLGLALALARWRGGIASDCVNCGRPFCRYCKRYGDPPAICTPCSRLRKDAGIESQVAYAEEVRRRARRRTRTCRLLSLLLPGTHRFFSDRPASGGLVLLAFFLFVAAAAIGGKLFDPLQLGVFSRPSLTAIAGLLAAALVWAGSLVSAWRRPHGA